MTSRLIHPRLMQNLERDFFPQSCALKQPVKARNTAGEETITHAVRSGYEAIACRVGPAGGGERRNKDGNYLDASHRIVLSGQFQDLTEEWMAEVDGREYQILLVSPDA